MRQASGSDRYFDQLSDDLERKSMDYDTFKNDTERRMFRRLFGVLSHLRAIESDMPIQQVVVLAWVALNEGKTQKKLRDSLGMASSTSSRNLTALSTLHRLGKPGLGLIEWVDSSEDRRQKLLYLSPKGRNFVADVLRIISSNRTSQP